MIVLSCVFAPAMDKATLPEEKVLARPQRKYIALMFGFNATKRQVRGLNCPILNRWYNEYSIKFQTLRAEMLSIWHATQPSLYNL